MCACIHTHVYVCVYVCVQSGRATGWEAVCACVCLLPSVGTAGSASGVDTRAAGQAIRIGSGGRPSCLPSLIPRGHWEPEPHPPTGGPITPKFLCLFLHITIHHLQTEFRSRENISTRQIRKILFRQEIPGPQASLTFPIHRLCLLTASRRFSMFAV